MPGTFESTIQRVNERSDSVRTTIPEGIARALEAVAGGVLVWTLDLRLGRVTVTARLPRDSKKSP